jgi:hypothetical protein
MEMEVTRCNCCVVQSCVTRNLAHEKELSLGLRELNDRERNERNSRKGDEIERHERSLRCFIANGSSI